MIEISVIIPTYNRAERLQVCLDALIHQTQPCDNFEVIVVIDGSNDKTVEMLEHYDSPYSLRSIWRENGGQASALNRGIREARGTICLLLDDDIIADEHLIAEHLLAQTQQQKAVVIGQIRLSLHEDADWYAKAFAEGWRKHYEQLNKDSTSITWEDCYSGNMSVPRDALLASGGFALILKRGYDVELANRLQKEGCTLIYAPNAIGSQIEQKRFRELSRDASNAGIADVMLYQLDPLMLSEALGSFAQGSWRKLLVHRFLLTFRIPPAFLEFLGQITRSQSLRYSLYSLTQKYCYWRGVRHAVGATDLWHQLIAGIPILMYHAIGREDEPASRFVLPVDRFEQHLSWIRRLGYQTISFGQFLEYKRNRLLPPVRSVVITFDDGYADNYSLAYPILQSHNIPATIFVVSDYVGRANEWDQEGDLAGRPLLSWTQVRELSSNGIQIGAHSCSHPVLTEISESEAKQQIAGSQKDLQSKLGVDIDIIAYPYGEYNETTQDTARQAGFMAGCTTDAQLNTLTSPSLALPRTEIRGNESFARFLLALWTGNTEALWWSRK
jgi:peptidoglycan/xylan/chitin deacetylase (PgdA/CDA1 family)/GT2 family glycosyltransferase